MDDLLDAVKSAAFAEYNRASIEYGLTNNSRHESYAVIKEEFEEACDEFEQFVGNLETLWRMIKKNRESGNIVERLERMMKFAENAAAEWIQVAAMCHKAIVSENAEVRDEPNI